MKPLEWFEKLWKGTGRSNQYMMLPPEQTRLSSGTQTDNTELKAGEHYFRLLLVEMFLANDRKWLTDWFPVVHTAISFKFGDQQELLTHVAGESFLNQLGQQKPGRIIGLNYPVTPLLPFNGGTIELNSGLVAVAGGNDVLACLQILGSFSQLLLVPQLSAALAVAMPLADGVAKFVGATQNQMFLGLHQSWSSASGGANVLRAGYFVVIAADSKTIVPQNLFVVDDGLRYGNKIESSTPLTDYNYMLFRLERRDERDDWDSLIAIQKPYERAIEMLEAGNIEQADAFIRAAKAAAFTAKELTAKIDRRRVIEQLEKAYQEANNLLGTRATDAFDVSKEIKLSNLMKNATRPDKAAKMGTILPEFVGLEGLKNHSIISAESQIDFSFGLDLLEPSAETSGTDIADNDQELEENFFFALKGKNVRGNSVQKGSEIDLVFDYGIPEDNLVAFVKGKEIELIRGESLDKMRKTDSAVGLMVSPRGFTFTDEKESGYRQIHFKDGKFAEGAVSFHLKAFDSKSYRKAFSISDKEIKETNRDKPESLIYSTGFHIAFDVNGIQVYRFFLPVKLVSRITKKESLVQPLSFDLDKLNESSKYVTQARSDLNEAITKILAGKEAW
jgi:hypothetical protein